jgi:uncharacterized membrane protein YgdD (TMEM256/DUF423 family)
MSDMPNTSTSDCATNLLSRPVLVAASAFYIALGVGCGAFGAHALRDAIPASDLAIWDKSVLYHLFHSLAALVIALSAHELIPQRKANSISAVLLVATTIFSGTLYLLVLLNQRWLGAITPLGGATFIATWLYLAYLTLRHSKQTQA